VVASNDEPGLELRGHGGAWTVAVNLSGVCEFNSDLSFSSSWEQVKSLKFNGRDPEPDVWPVLQRDVKSVIVRGVPVATERELAKKAGDLARYSLTVKTASNNAVTLEDRACNYVDAKEISDYLAITFPSYVTDKIRDFIMILECSAYTPAISYESVITLEGEEDIDLTPEEGVNVYFFTEFDTGRFAVARKLITKLVDNIPVTGAQLLRIVAKQGVTASSYGDIMVNLGLTEANNIADAVNAVMKG
jgi:hypothetical protein